MNVKNTITQAGVFSLLFVQLPAGMAETVNDNEKEKKDEIVISVTSTREETDLKSVPASIGVINQDAIESAKPAHPSEIATQVPGVHINVTGGEGHMTAIRQPISTQPVYLYLEDGIPTRSTGFFNHNALYEVNLPQSSSIEISRGPGTSLYGSDAIGGVINVLTAKPPLQPEMNLNIEAGSFSWQRLLADTGNSDEDSGYIAGINLTHSDGWRDATNYDRISANFRRDLFLDSGAVVKVIFSTTDVDQQTAGSSRLLEIDYLNNPELNYTPISYRKVQATRLSASYEKESKNELLTITPYLRSNNMELLPNWSLSYDPVVYETGHDSVGVLVKHRIKLADKQTLISGIDIDYSPGDYHSNAISSTPVNGFYTDYTVGAVLYDYDATFSAISPYLHYEKSLSPTLHLQAGARYDFMAYDYDNKLTELTTGTHRRPADTTVSYEHFSPKLGLSFDLSPHSTGYVNYRHAFRAPSSSQLFTQGQAENTVDLEPVKIDSIEAGIKTRSVNNKLQYSLSIYSMSKKDDILSFRNPDSTRETLNAGETSHKGIEFGLDASIKRNQSVKVSASYAVHRYEDWQPNTTTDYSGNEMESAPRTIINILYDIKPISMPKLKMSTELVHLGSYWMDQANTAKYDGHQLLNLRANYEIDKKSTTYLRIMNVTDERYATAASYKPAAFGNPEKFEYAPGAPLSIYIGYQHQF